MGEWERLEHIYKIWEAYMISCPSLEHLPVITIFRIMKRMALHDTLTLCKQVPSQLQGEKNREANQYSYHMSHKP